jgi:secreted Zn-dependent insulinase-like peptidase
MSSLLNETHWLDTDLLKSIDSVSVQDLEGFMGQFSGSGVQVQALAYGNVNKKVKF